MEKQAYPMTKDEFKARQTALGYDNHAKDFAKALGVQHVTIKKYRSGDRAISWRTGVLLATLKPRSSRKSSRKNTPYNPPKRTKTPEHTET